jgi:hypothetical protein
MILCIFLLRCMTRHGREQDRDLLALHAQQWPCEQLFDCAQDMSWAAQDSQVWGDPDVHTMASFDGSFLCMQLFFFVWCVSLMKGVVFRNPAYGNLLVNDTAMFEYMLQIAPNSYSCLVQKKTASLMPCLSSWRSIALGLIHPYPCPDDILQYYHHLCHCTIPVNLPTVLTYLYTHNAAAPSPGHPSFSHSNACYMSATMESTLLLGQKLYCEQHL